MKTNDKNNKSFIISGQYLQVPPVNPTYSFENFDIQNKSILGTGALSAVFLCTNKIDQKKYAVKVTQKDKLKSRNLDNEIIYSEVEIHKKILHPNIVRLYSYYESNSAFYLFLEYVNGTTLYEKNKYGHTEKEACKYFSQVVNAIYFCHKNGLIHRDIKLENCLVDDDDNVKVCDFGWCAQLTKSTQKRETICGTYEYMAPELIKEEMYNYSIDIWALGIMLYELIHGYSPFKSEKNDHKEIFQNVLDYNINIEREISDNCCDLIMKLLTSNAKKRITINEVIAHPWFNDWLEVEEYSEDIPPIQVEQDLFDNVINVVQKKNQSEKSKKRMKSKAKPQRKKVQEKEMDLPLESKQPNKSNLNIEELTKQINLKEDIANIKHVFNGDHEENHDNEQIIIGNKTSSTCDKSQIIQVATYEPKKESQNENEEIYDFNWQDEEKKSNEEKKNLESTIQLFNKADQLKIDNTKKVSIKPAGNFWDKIFAPFKCG